MLLVPRWAGLVLDKVLGRLGRDWMLQESTRDPDRRESETPSGLE